MKYAEQIIYLYRCIGELQERIKVLSSFEKDMGNDEVMQKEIHNQISAYATSIVTTLHAIDALRWVN